jgi:hypothetical protein
LKRIDSGMFLGEQVFSLQQCSQVWIHKSCSLYLALCAGDLISVRIR